MNPKRLFKTMISTALVATLALTALPVTAFAATKPKYTPVKVDYRADYFYIKNKNSGKYLDVSGGTANKGTNVIQWSFTGKKNQQWAFQKLSNGNYVIITLAGKDPDTWWHCLDVSKESTKSGANVGLWTRTEGYPENQQWSFKPQKDGSYKMYNITGGKYLSVAGGSKNNGANVVQGTAGDVWILESDKAEKKKEYNPLNHYTDPKRTIHDIDVKALINYGIKYGESVGMTYDPTITKGYGTWDTPIEIHASYANSVTEEALRSRLSRYKKNGDDVFGLWYEYDAGKTEWIKYTDPSTGKSHTVKSTRTPCIKLYVGYAGGTGGNKDFIVEYD